MREVSAAGRGCGDHEQRHEYAEGWVKLPLLEFPKHWREWKICVGTNGWFLTGRRWRQYWKAGWSVITKRRPKASKRTTPRGTGTHQGHLGKRVTGSKLWLRNLTWQPLCLEKRNKMSQQASVRPPNWPSFPSKPAYTPPPDFLLKDIFHRSYSPYFCPFPLPISLLLMG